MSESSKSTLIRNVRIRTGASDWLAKRQEIERTLQASALHPIELPDDAILAVRQVTIRQTSQSQWHEAVSMKLSHLVREAARPINDSVPANAQAVIFRDRSEMLACLAADWCAGEVAMHWWWKSLLRSGDVDRAVIDAWLESPHEIPAAFQKLRARSASAQHTNSTQKGYRLLGS